MKHELEDRVCLNLEFCRKIGAIMQLKDKKGEIYSITRWPNPGLDNVSVQWDDGERGVFKENDLINLTRGHA
jgi:hypothetical protein